MKLFKKASVGESLAQPTFDFAPIISINPIGLSGQVLIRFDSNHLLDSKRSTILFKAPMPTANGGGLEFLVNGFDEASATYVGNKQRICGDIQCVVVDCSKQDQEAVDSSVNVIRSIPLAFDLTGAARIEGDCEFMKPDDVKRLLRQGMARALNAAWAQYFDLKNAPATRSNLVNSGMSMMAHGAPVVADAQSAQPMSEKARNKLLLAMIIGPAIAGVLIWLLVGGQPKQTPYEEALAAALASDPAAVEASVNMTKQALAEMGLDPGAAGDMGCLAPTQ